MFDLPQLLNAAFRDHQAGRMEDAERGYRQILAVMPQHFDALHLLGVVQQQRGRYDEALGLLQAAIRVQPTSAEAHFNLAKTWHDAGRFDEAAASYRQAILRKLSFAEAHFNLGNVLREQHRYDESAAAFREALRVRPNYPKALANLGSVLTDLGQFEEAERVLLQVRAVQPDNPRVLSNLGSALRALGRQAEAEPLLLRSLQLDPQQAEAWNNLATVQLDTLRFDEAERSLQEALRLRPDYPRAHLNRAFLWLQRGDYGRGWEEYEWRWRCPEWTPRPGVRRWQGESLVGGTLLLSTEQGLGDGLQFVRYARPAKERSGARVVVECPPALLAVLARTPGIDQLVPAGTPVACDAHAPLMSLPWILGTTLDTVPADVPYVRTDEERLARWQTRLAALSGVRVGIAWQGNPKQRQDRFRSLPLAAFEPLARLPNVRLLSLQKGFGAEQVAAVADRFTVQSLGDDVDASAAFVDTAAILRHLDLVITPDTAIAHLAGAVGARTWLLLQHASEWRWLLERDDTPWYPTMRLFRQPSRGDWDSVLRSVAARLASEFT